MKIGQVSLEGNILMAPVAGVGDMPYRKICRGMGAGLVYTEMISAKALFYHDKKTEKLMTMHPSEHPVAMQIFGSAPEVMAYAAGCAAAAGADIIDINMGCPVPKIIKSGDGSALMKNPTLAGQIAKAVVSAVSIPVTAKIRKGFDSCNAIEVAKILQDSGISAIGLHGRTRDQMYSGKADWDIIRQVKEALDIPIIGSGDVFTAHDAKAMLDTTGCDGVMIARGMFGNPWIFAQANELLRSGEIKTNPSVNDRIDMAIFHTKCLIEYKKEHGIKEARAHLLWYIKGMHGAAKIKNALATVNSLLQVQEILEELRE